LKRRNFLASLAGISLFASEAWAAKKQKTSVTKASSAKSKSGKATKSGKAGKTKGGKKSAHASHAAQERPRAPVAHTADDPVTETPPQGTSASRLPPRAWSFNTRSPRRAV